VKQGRESGGILIWYESELTNSVKLIKTGQFYIWLEIDRGLTASEENILPCATYNPPLESLYYNEESFSIRRRSTTTRPMVIF
jgi:hypothetical protein